ncbi:MAG: hypothetical protein K2N54_09145 [Helicobacter sp.]|nr:hypothetical protein [Helicobacter sp.]
MYKKEFMQKYVSPRKIPDAIFLYGHSFSVDYTANLVLSVLDCSEDELTKIYFDEYQFKNLYELVLSPSLFAARSVFLVKINKKIPKKDLAALMERKSKAVTLILCFFQSGDVQSYASDCREMDGAFKGGVSVRFFEPNAFESTQLLREMAQAANLKIDNANLLELFHHHNGDFYLIEGDIKKLATLGHEIGSKDIKEHVFGLASWNLDALCLALFEKKDCLDMAAKMLQSGSSGREIIMGMESFFMRFFLVFCHNKIYGRTDFAEIFGYTPPVHVQKNFDWALRLSELQYQRLFEVLQSGFLQLFERGSDTEREVFSVLIKLQAIFR